MFVVYFWHNESALVSAARACRIHFRIISSAFFFFKATLWIGGTLLKNTRLLFNLYIMFYHSNGAPEEDI